MDLTNIERSGTIDSGVDWLTVTTVAGQESARMLETARAFVLEAYPNEALPEAWSAMGYKGQSYGALKYGRRKQDEAILILSSGLADKFGIRFRIPPDRVTRCDLQVTVALDEPDPYVAYKLYQALTRQVENGNLTTRLKYISSGTGDTLYIGSRSSELSLRLYDKSKDYPGMDRGLAWRSEVEYKRGRAKSVYRSIESARARYTRIATHVFDEFQRKGVSPLFDKGEPNVAMETQVKVSTPDTKLSWLERCVAPVVTQLVTLGYEEEVIRSLKLAGVYRRE